jgi:hypothetical protein
MSTDTVIFKGKCRWAKIYPDNLSSPYEAAQKGKWKTAAHPLDREFTVQVECSEKQLGDLYKKGVSRMTSLKEDEEGNTYINLKADKVKVQKEKNRKLTFKDIAVTDSEGNSFSEKVGNGSTVEATVELIELEKGAKLQLKSIKVLEHIPYEGKSDVQVEELESATEYTPDSEEAPWL